MVRLRSPERRGSQGSSDGKHPVCVAWDRPPSRIGPRGQTGAEACFLLDSPEVGFGRVARDFEPSPGIHGSSLPATLRPVVAPGRGGGGLSLRRHPKPEHSNGLPRRVSGPGQLRRRPCSVRGRVLQPALAARRREPGFPTIDLCREAWLRDGSAVRGEPTRRPMRRAQGRAARPADRVSQRRCAASIDSRRQRTGGEPRLHRQRRVLAAARRGRVGFSLRVAQRVRRPLLLPVPSQRVSGAARAGRAGTCLREPALREPSASLRCAGGVAAMQGERSKGAGALSRPRGQRTRAPSCGSLPLQCCSASSSGGSACAPCPDPALRRRYFPRGYAAAHAVRFHRAYCCASSG